MRYCVNCGKAIEDNAAVCPSCGTTEILSNQSASVIEKSGALATWAIICAFVVPLVGLVLGIIGCCTYKREAKYRKLCIAAIPISVVIGVGAVILTVSYFLL